MDDGYVAVLLAKIFIHLELLIGVTYWLIAIMVQLIYVGLTLYSMLTVDVLVWQDSS